MRNSQLLQEKAELNLLLDNIKKEYAQSIKYVLQKNNPKLFGNINKVPRLTKIQINRG